MSVKNTVSGLSAPVHLRCEGLKDPMGLDEPRPRFSWHVSDTRRGAVQGGYQVMVASSLAKLQADEGDVWDSGQVASGQSVYVEYGGEGLASRRACWWKVRTWDQDGAVSPWSETGRFEMGLLGADDWAGKWIGSGVSVKEDTQPSPYLRRRFDVAGEVVKARVYVTAGGLYELSINGEKVGQDYLRPGWTGFSKRVTYQAYDVTEYVQAGENVIGAVLGDGWFAGYLVFHGNRALYGEQLSLKAQLELTFADGSTQRVVTDDQWKTKTGPILKSDIYMGEEYDARLEMPGWDGVGYDDGGWEAVKVVDGPSGELVAQRCQPVQVINEIVPVEVKAIDGGGSMFNLGQNMVGLARLKVKGKAGTVVKLRFGEWLNDDGSLYTENLRGAKATDYYTLRGDEAGEVYMPTFTFHGFQYVELTVEGQLDCEVTRDTITGVVLHSNTPRIGDFKCSDERVNQLQSNILWGQKCNFLEVPTDCPQRNERLGWTGDAQVFVRTASFNMDVNTFFDKWMVDLTDDQRDDGSIPHVSPNVLGQNSYGAPAWADAVVICPWVIYQCYGDRRILERNYDAMAGWVDCMVKFSDTLVQTDGWFGDWLAVDAVTPGAAPTPTDLISTAYFAYCAQIMAKTAAVLGKADDVKRYEQLNESIREVFNRTFVTEAGRLVGHTQTGYAIALAFDLLPVEKQAIAVEQLVKLIEKRDNHLATGFVGTPLLAPVLSKYGRTDVAYRLLMQDTYPSWLYTVKQGATTMWERWDSWTDDKGFQTPSMNSFNHYAYGSIGEWMYARVAGIGVDDEAVGYQNILIRPEVGGGLTSAQGELLSPYGLIESAWRVDGDKFVLNVTIPANTTATVTLPGIVSGDVMESGRTVSEVDGVTTVNEEGGRVVVEVGAGSYCFEAVVTE